jgi:hypothetical protein
VSGNAGSTNQPPRWIYGVVLVAAVVGIILGIWVFNGLT